MQLARSGDNHKKRADALRKREPALINLPVPVPTIPILAPIITPLIGGEPVSTPGTTAQATQSTVLTSIAPTLVPIPVSISIPILVPSLIPTPAPSSTPASAPSPIPAPAPAPSPIPAPAPAPISSPAPVPASAPTPSTNGKSPGNGSSGGSSGSHTPNGSSDSSGGGGSSNGGSSGGDTNSGGEGSSGEGPSGGGPSGGGPSGGGTTPGKTSGGGTASDNKPSGNSSGGETPGGIPSNSPTTTAETSDGSNKGPLPTPSAVNGAQNNNGTEGTSQLANAPSETISTSIAPGSGNITNSGSPDPVVNAILQPVGSLSLTTGTVGPSGSDITNQRASGTGGISPSGTAGSGSGSGSGGSTGNGSNNATSGAHSKISPAMLGAIGAIAGFILLFLALFLARRWHKKRRAARLREWSDRAFPQMASARSSFATTVDYGLRPITPVVIPPMPERAAEIVRTATRSSTLSTSSEGSDTHRYSGQSQYLFVQATDMDAPQPSPISVRPFSPTESWSFPKPPNRASDRESVVTTSMLTSSPVTPHSSNPFLTQAEQATEKICRPFLPSLPDELAVKRGDEIRVINVFDDGWASVEKCAGGSGLIPIDCLREMGEDLPAFLASKRVSSYIIAQ